MNNNVLLVDEHPIMRMALSRWLKQNNFRIVAQASNGLEAMQFIHKHEPHIIILDVDIPRVSGYVIIDRIRLLELPIKVIVFSAQNSRLGIIDCAEAGAHGFVSKSEDPHVLIAAIRAVQSGEKFFPVWVRRDQREGEAPMERLSWRERQVLQLLRQGLSNKQVADRLELSNKTISTFKTRVLKKLNATSLVELISRTHHEGLSG